MFKPLDILIYAGIILIIILPFISEKENLSNNILVTIGTEYNQNFDATIDSVYTIEYNGVHVIVEVKSGAVRITESACKNKHCIKHGWLKPNDYDKIICMPQKVIISFDKDDNEDEFDGIVG